MNVCGLKQRLNYPEFSTLVKSYDIFCIQESKLDDIDVVSLDGYAFFHQTRKQKYKRKSGGIGVFVKESVFRNFEIVNSSSDYILWLKVSFKGKEHDNDFVFGVVYKPPESSRFLTDDETQLFEVEITSMCVDYKNVYLIGDMNAHTGYKADFIEADQFLADNFDFDSELLNYFNKSEMLDKYQCPKTEQIKIAHLTQKVENLLKSVNQITFLY